MMLGYVGVFPCSDDSDEDDDDVIDTLDDMTGKRSCVCKLRVINLPY
jgi:hypothetical protein